jgi:hypothetical protein
VLGAVKVAAMAGEVFRCGERVQCLPRLGDRGFGDAARIAPLVREVPPPAGADEDEENNEADLLEAIDRDEIPIERPRLASS